nr:MAG TPA: hypothetical protein [Caudoviricetes sp.]
MNDFLLTIIYVYSRTFYCSKISSPYILSLFLNNVKSYF